MATPPAQPENSNASAKIPQPRTEIPKTSAKTAELGKKSLPRQHCARQRQEPSQEPAAQPAHTLQEKHRTNKQHTHKKPIMVPQERQIVRLGNKGGVAAPGDTDEALNCANTAGTPEEPHRMYSGHPVHESNQTEVLESMKVIGSLTANAH